ncbi:hypothetical protein Tco_1049941, partial [Tanacetum coccineum]
YILDRIDYAEHHQEDGELENKVLKSGCDMDGNIARHHEPTERIVFKSYRRPNERMVFKPCIARQNSVEHRGPKERIA